MKIQPRVFLICCLLIPISNMVLADSKTHSATQSKTSTVKDRQFAMVGKESVSEQDFQMALSQAIRRKFYHGKISREVMASYRQEIAEQLVADILLAQEAKRRGLKVVMADIQSKLDALDKKNQKIAKWKKERKKALALLKKYLVREALNDRLEEVIRGVPKVTQPELEKYYKANPDKFTAPEKWAVSVILLKVDPSSKREVWEAAIEEAGGIVQRLRKGASFAELARIHSSDESAKDGGNMGYIHKGMLAKPAQDILQLMVIGEISEPVVLLSGITVFRLDGVQPPHLNKLKKVAQRASGLLLREKKQQAWEEFSQKITRDSTFTINQDVVKIDKEIKPGKNNKGS